MKSNDKSRMATTSPESRVFLLEAALVALLGMTPASALEEAYGHVELSPVYDIGNGTWDWKSYWFDDELNERDDAVGTLCFPGLDEAPSSYGVRQIRPADPKWDFLGVAAGEPVWIFSDASYASVGFASTQTELTGDLSFLLDRVTGPEGGSFSMYAGGTPTIHMQTLDGISAADEFRKPPNHSHVNWAFSRKGLWIVELKVRGNLAATGMPTNQSPAQPIVFAIGDHARWKAAHFNQVELATPAISGDGADPDADGIGNLMEYALGGDPRAASAVRMSDSQPIAPRLLPPANSGAPWQFCYFQRTAGDEADVSYTVESSATPAPDSWSPESGTGEILPSVDGWQYVAVPLAFPPNGTNARFYRLKLAAIP
jgi:hypothetical protein